MKIREIHALGLYGATPEGGWSNELRPDDCVHTVIIVQTDEELCGLGSVFTSDDLVRGALKVLQPLYAGEDLQFSRDYRFLGHVGFWDTLFLPLKAGLNEVAFVVTDETNGGTAAAAHIEPDPAIKIE